MAHIVDVLVNYEAGRIAEKSGAYLLAARYYRVCSIIYDCTEQYYDSEVEAGERAKEGYWNCRKHLSQEDILMLNREYGQRPSDWREYVRMEYDRIFKLPHPAEVTELNKAKEVTILGTTILNY